MAPSGYWNLGLAHGIPGVVAMLARYVSAGLEVERSQQLLQDAIAFLLAAEPPNNAGRFPAWHPRDRVADRRLAWCYGDLGVSVALLSAATACRREGWRVEALELARQCARTGFEDAQVVDASLCHGASGAAHLFHRLYYATGERIFADAALRWLDHTLAMRSDSPIAGFPARRDVSEGPKWSADTSILTGAAGVALVLHAMISEVEPSWDRLLLVDIGPG